MIAMVVWLAQHPSILRGFEIRIEGNLVNAHVGETGRETDPVAEIVPGTSLGVEVVPGTSLVVEVGRGTSPDTEIVPVVEVGHGTSPDTEIDRGRDVIELTLGKMNLIYLQIRLLHDFHIFSPFFTYFLPWKIHISPKIITLVRSRISGTQDRSKDRGKDNKDRKGPKPVIRSSQF